MLTKIKKLVLITIFILANVVTVAVVPALADDPDPGNGCGSTQSNPVTFFPTWYDGLLCSNGDIKSPNDSSLGANANSGQRLGTWLTIIAMNIVRMLLFAVGYASLAFIIWGGFKYMTQGDSSSGTVAARKTIQNAVIGLVISIMSVSLVTFVTQKISQAGSSGNCATTTSAQQSTSTQAATSVQIKASDLGLSGAPCGIDSSTVGNILGIVYLLAGMVAVISIIIGGIRYAGANGDSGQIQSAKNMIMYAVVGLVVIIMAAALTQFVITQVTK